MPVRGRAAPIGAHVSIAGGLVSGALRRADAIGAGAIQIFITNPRGWSPGPDPEAADVAAFRSGADERGLQVFVHAPYLINLGAPDPLVATRSEAALALAVARATALGARGVVVHAGSAVVPGRLDAALAQAAAAVGRVLDGAPDGAPRLLIEPTAGGGAALASDLTSLGRYLAALGHDERVGLCLDTCHLHAAGHDLSAPGGVRRTVAAIVRSVGRGRIGLVHVNDSRDRAGSRRDRHASLGTGTIGADAFGELFTAPGTRHVPLVVETPEADQLADLTLLRALAAQPVRP